MRNLFGILVFLFLAVFSHQLVFAQNEALKIDVNGNIGIGTNKPFSLLDVNGTVNLRGANNGTGLIVDSAGNVGVGITPAHKLSVAGNANLFGSLYIHQPNSKSTAPSLSMGWWKQGASFIQASENAGTANLLLQPNSGNVIIGVKDEHTSAKAKLVIGGENAQQGLDLSSANQYANMRVIQNTNGKDDKDLHIGYESGKKSSLHLYSNNNKTLTVAEGNVKVNGDLIATRVNGEKPPLIFEIGDKNSKNWVAVNQDIGALCGDADGCTMKFFLRDNTNDEVKAISELIYIEQPDKSNNRRKGLHGYSWHLGGKEISFVLGTDTKNDLINWPFEWIYVRNYGSPDVGKETNAYSGYNVQFMTRANISATVIIYDR